MARTKEEIGQIKLAVVLTLKDDHPMTLRQTFYQLVVQGVIGKTENDYKSLGRLLVKMREQEDIPWSWIVDLGREIQIPTTHADAAAALQYTADHYWIDRQRNQPVKIVVAIESHGLGSVIWPVTAEYNVPLIASGGYASASIKYTVASEMEEDGRPVLMYYFGDYDPSGQDISRDWRDTIRRYMPGINLDFEHVALTPNQIAEWKLPGKPPKKGDSRTAKFVGECVELDAIPKKVLLQLVRDAIEQCLDPDLYEEALEQETADRKSLRDAIAKM